MRTSIQSTLKSQGTVLLPDDPYVQAQVLQCIYDVGCRYSNLCHVQDLLVVRFLIQSFRLEKVGNEDLIYYIWHTPTERYNHDLLKQRQDALIMELIRWDTRFEQRNEDIFYAVGKQFTLADMFLFPQLALLVHCAYPIDLHRNIGSNKRVTISI
jgi:glutathione S-transferase